MIDIEPAESLDVPLRAEFRLVTLHDLGSTTTNESDCYDEEVYREWADAWGQQISSWSHSPKGTGLSDTF